MNEHIKLILIFSNIVLGAVYLVYLYNVRKHHDQSYLRWLFYSGIIFNSFNLFTFLTKYWITNVLGIPDYHRVFFIRDYLGELVNFIQLCFFLIIYYEMNGTDRRSGIMKILKIGSIIIIVVHILKEYPFNNTMFDEIVEYFFLILYFLYSLIYIVSLILLFLTNAINQDAPPEYIRKSFAGFFIFPQIYLIVYVLLWFFAYSYLGKNIIAAIDMFGYINLNLFPLLWLKFSFVRYYRNMVKEPLPDIQWENYQEKYKLTKRETEIIRLLLIGKSNKEIEDELFLSMHTVKNHIYNIYKKLGVSSRIQVMNMFMHVKD